MRLKCLGVVPARIGSKGIPKKNLYDIANRPLVVWAIDALMRSSVVGSVVVSHDSDETVEAISLFHDHGVHLIRRPEELSGDDVHASKVVMNALKWYITAYETPELVCMQLPTAPFIESHSISVAADTLLKSSSPSIIGVQYVGPVNSLRYKRFDSIVPMFLDLDRNAQRQSQDKAYVVTGSLFIARTEEFLKHGTFHLPGALCHELDPIESFDINTQEDLDFAERVAAWWP